jgi:hypothetical protein
MHCSYHTNLKYMVNKFAEVTNNWVEASEFHVVEQNTWQTGKKYYCKKPIQSVKYEM